MKPKHILVIRLSAMGDVAMTIPVLQQLLQQNPQIHLTVLTRQLFVPLFDSLPRTSVFPVETKGRHKGVTGLFKLYRELRKQHQFDAVADLHNVLRSKLVRFLFSSAGIKSAAIDKGRKEKKQLTHWHGYHWQQLDTCIHCSSYGDSYRFTACHRHASL